MCCRYWADESPEIREIVEEMNKSPLVDKWQRTTGITTYGEIRPTNVVCTYFHIDLQALGYTKRFINSDVRVAYNYVYYYYAKYTLPNTFELLYYFVYYFRYFFKKRNKDMSNSISKDVKLSDLMNNWYLFHKLKI